MTLWNLLIVFCFAVLYLGLVMVFLQIRRLRDEIKVRFYMHSFPDEMISESGRENMSRELDEIRDQLLTLNRKLTRLMSKEPATGGSVESMVGAHAIACGMLKKGATELEVVEQTGLSFGEVSLLKRLNESSEDA